jgi:hypothetical protein
MTTATVPTATDKTTVISPDSTAKLAALKPGTRASKADAETAAKRVTRTPRTPKPAKPAGPTTAELEAMAGGFIATGTQAGMSLVDVLCQLHARSAWQEHTMPIATYFCDVIGIGAESGFVLPRTARQELVKRMAETDAPNAVLCQMTGASLRTIANDRAALGIANENRQAGQKSGETDAGETGNDNDTADNETGETDAKPAKVKLAKPADVIAAIDQATDAAFLANVMAHVSARYAALTAAAE